MTQYTSERTAGECGILKSLVDAAEGAPCVCHPVTGQKRDSNCK